MIRGNLVAGSLGNLPQKSAVLDSAVAGVATVAGFFRSTCKTQKENTQRGNLFKSAATPATVATALCWSLSLRGRFSVWVATNLPHQVVPAWR